MDVQADELTEAMTQLHALECATRVQQLTFVVAYDEGEFWRADGATSMSAWLCGKFCLSPRSAHQLVTVAHEASVLPAITAVFSSGLLSWEQFVLLCSFASAETDSELAEQAVGLSLGQLKRMARDHRVIARRAEESHRNRSLRWRWNEDRSALRLSGVLDSEQGVAFIAALEAQVGRNSQPDPLTGLYPEFDTQCADALMDLIGGSTLATTLIVHLNDDGTGETETGVTFPPAVVDRLSCDASKQIAHWRDGVPLGIGRKSRDIPPWLERLVRKRDGFTCRFPGCSRQKWLNSHHVRFWSKDGNTDEDNLISLCWTHHRLLHEGRWKIRGDVRQQVQFIAPNDQVLMARNVGIKPEVREWLDERLGRVPMLDSA